MLFRTTPNGLPTHEYREVVVALPVASATESRLDVSVIGPQTTNSIGSRGDSEIGIAGISVTIAKAVYNATAKQVREYPIIPDKLLA